MADEPDLSQDVSPQPAHVVTFRVTAEVIPDSDETPTPVTFRYTFINGDRIESAALVYTEEQSDWREVGHSTGDALDPPYSTTLRTFTRDHDITATDEFIQSFNEQPVVCFFVGTLPPDGEAKPRKYTCAVHCDLSAFLSNEMRVVAVRDQRNRLQRLITVNKKKKSKKTTQNEAPSTIQATGPSTAAAPPPDDAPFRYLRVTVQLAPDSPRLMSDEALQKHNPLTIALGKVQSLPGVRTTSVPLLKYLEPNPHVLLRQYCRNLYCIVRPPLMAPRGSATDARSASGDVAFEHSVVYLTGHISRVELEEALSSMPITFEVHDRDLVALRGDDSDRLDALLAAPELALRSWERVARGEDSFQTISREVNQARGWKVKRTTTSEDNANEEEEVDESREVDVFDVDALYTKALVASWARAGDDHTHGYAEIRVEALLDSAAKLAEAFKQRGKPPTPPVVAPRTVTEVTTGDQENEKATDDQADEHILPEGGGEENARKQQQSEPTTEDYGEVSTTCRKLEIAPSQPTVKCKADVTARKQRIIPKGGVDNWRLNEAQRLAVLPGAYLETTTVIAIRATLFRTVRTLADGAFYNGAFWEKTYGDQPFPAPGTKDNEESGPIATRLAGKSAPFTRATLIIPYDDSTTLQSLMAAIDGVNRRALGETITGSLRSYQLTSNEIAEAEAGALDIVGGFQIIDANSRMIAIEGLTASITEVLRSVSPRGVGYQLLSDPSVRFLRRLYTAFNTDLKKVRLREPLAVLSRSPEIYNRTKVSADCFDALYRLMNVTRSPTLKELCMACGLPEVHMILQLESKFGEPITTTDVDGRPPKQPKKKRKKKKTTTATIHEVLMEEENDDDEEEFEDVDRRPTTAEAEEPSVTENLRVAEKPALRKAPTDSSNPEFEIARRNRQVVNYVELRREESREAALAYEYWRQERKAERAADRVPCDYVYSGQARQYTELKKAEQRARLRNERNATFVRSDCADYLSLTVPLVDETRLKQDEADASRARWKTKRGFIYPAPKPPSEYNAHPQKPSAARIDDLAEPWVEGSTHGADLSRVDDASLVIDPDRPFDTIPAMARSCFGGLERPTYERAYDGNYLGNPTRLPRGKDISRKIDDTQYHRSVHLCGEGLAQEKAEAKRREEDTFRSKLVVDTLDFKIGRYCQIDRPSQTDRLKDVLHDEPKTRFLKAVRNARLPSGKVCRLRPAPYSIFANEQYAPPSQFSDELRTYPGDITGDTDWTKAIHSDTFRRASERILYHRPISQLTPEDVAGDLRW